MSEYPHLGFDPARGNVTTVRELAKQIKDTGTYAKEAYEAIKAVQDNKDVWTGPAARAFAGQLGELPKYLDDAQSSMEIAGTALSNWSDDLEAHQKKARGLEEAVRKAINAAENADQALATAQANDVPIAYDTSDPVAAQNAQARADANAQAVRNAQAAATSAWDRVEDIRQQARTLRDRWEDDGRVCADKLNEAAEKAPNKAFFESFGELFDDAGQWLKDHIGDIGDIAGIVSAVAGVLAFIPVLTPIMAPIALGAGAIALAAHGADMVVNEKYDDPNAWIGLGGDAIGLIPGARAVKAGLSAAGDVVAGTDRIVDVTRATGVTGMMDTAGEATLRGAGRFGGKLKEEIDLMVDPGKMYQWVADRTMGSGAYLDPTLTTNVAKALETSVTVTPQIPSAANLFENTEENTNLKDTTGNMDAGRGLISYIADSRLP